MQEVDEVIFEKFDTFSDDLIVSRTGLTIFEIDPSSIKLNYSPDFRSFTSDYWLVIRCSFVCVSPRRCLPM